MSSNLKLQRYKPDKPKELYFEDLWQAAFPVGTEWANMDKIRDETFGSFSNLENAFDEGGELHGKNAYMFGSTEDLQSLKADEYEDDTVIDIIFPPEPLEPLVVCDYDWLVDSVEEFTDILVMGELLPEDMKDDFKAYVKVQVRAKIKKIQRQAKEARKKVIEDRDPETRAAMENMKFHEFCPVQTPDTPDISKVKACALKKEEDDVRSSSDCCN